MLPNLYKNRHGTYYLRVTIHGREIKRSLRTKEPARAKLAAIAFAWATMTNAQKPTAAQGLPLDLDPAALRELEVILPSGAKIADIRTDEDARRAVLMMRALEAGAPVGAAVDAMEAPSPALTEARLEALISAQTARARPAASLGKTKPFSEACAMYLEEKKLGGNSPKTIDDKRNAYAAFQGMHGDLDMGAYTDAMALGWKQRLIAQGLSPVRVNTKISQFKDLFDWAQNNKLRLNGNPFDRMRVVGKKVRTQKTESYEPFTQAELDLIFEPKGYAAYMNKPDYKWLPLLALYTGARIEELASLEVGHVKQAGDVWLLDIRKGKNSNSIRKVPLHSVVERSGFLAYVEATANAGRKDAEGRMLLFPHLKPGKNGYSKNCGRRFAQWLDKVGITDERKVFHSFRATFITRMSELNTHPAMLMALVGHYEQAQVDLSAPHYKNYQGAKLASALKETMERFDVRVPSECQATPRMFRGAA
ncbi:site-specific integrase [Aquincola tertiaricarbonis]|uniref:Site-specific integrase n=1 Tax=Aquincola tertiaricarbonis TaxID=391953 RepID=A0ABY4SBH2_AQUTE|nr:site-specific integrase [Aquincola tertiaricarbonis]URI09422.1 site-specific integrase [Aquincola tertiaricarbonis]